MPIFISIYICNICNIYIFVEDLLKWIKEREKRNDILNSQVLLITNHVRTFFNVKSCDIQQPIRYFKLFANWYINIPLTDFWEKVNSVQQLQMIYVITYVIRYTCKSFDIRGAHGKFSKKIWIQIYQFWNLYCNTVESFARPKICKMFKFCMDELLQIATKEKFCEANFREHQNFISFNFTNKLRLPTWIFDVMYYFEW